MSSLGGGAWTHSNERHLAALVAYGELAQFGAALLNAEATFENDEHGVTRVAFTHHDLARGDALQLRRGDHAHQLAFVQPREQRDRREHLAFQRRALRPQTTGNVAGGDSNNHCRDVVFTAAAVRKCNEFPYDGVAVRDFEERRDRPGGVVQVARETIRAE